MPISVLCFYTRLPTISPADFKDRMEKVHVPILKDVMGPHFPTTYTLHYVERAESGIGDSLGASIDSKKNNPTAPVMLVGLPSDLGWDVYGEMIFQDMLHLQQGLSSINSLDGQRVKDDEDRFTITEKLKVVIMGAKTTV